jgi:hypothetical protein
MQQERAWLDDEPPLGPSAARELSRAWRGARRRLIPITALALALSAAAGALAATRAPSYTATAAVTLATDGDDDQEPASSGELRAYLEDVVFSSDRLVPIVERHFTTSPGTRLRDVAELREQMKVEVDQPDLVESREAPDLREPARLTLAFTAATPELAQAVTSSLLALIAEVESLQRRSDAQGEASAARSTLERARLRWDRVTREARRQGPVARQRQELQSVAEEIKAASVRLAEAELAGERTPVAANLRFRVLDAVRVPRAALPPWGRFARTSLLGFPVVFVGCALLWGDRRLFSAEDVLAAGLSVPLLAHITGIPSREVS